MQGFWVHFDVDVLDDAIMPAVDYRQEGGLTWDEAAVLRQGLLEQPDARGLEVTIFNPNLDLSRASPATFAISSRVPSAERCCRTGRPGWFMMRE